MNVLPTSSVPTAKASKRRGVVLVAVLVVIVLLSLAGYQYNEMMLQEYKVSEYAHRSMQAKALADSGIHYAAGMLSSENNFYGLLGGNPFDNPELFKEKQVQGDDKIPKGFFTLIAPPEVPGGDLRYGVMDESGKINLNAIMEIDKKENNGGMYLQLMLEKLPNMTPEIAASIVCWMYPDNTVTPAGAKDDYYMGLSPPYRTKGGPIDSIDELLLVKGVTPELLYGSDTNRNGVQDEEEGSNGFQRGWSAFLTVHSREPNYDATGKLYVYLNMADGTQLGEALKEAGIDEELIGFINVYRYGKWTAKPDAKTLGRVKETSVASFKVPSSTATPKKLNAIFDLVSDLYEKDGNLQNNKQNYKLYKSPLSDPAKQRDLLPQLFKVTTLWNTVDGDPTNPAYLEMPARINVNTAPPEVLGALTAKILETELTGLTDEDITKITGPKDLSNSIYQTPAWLLTEATIDIAKLKKLEKWVTTRTQVFRVQSVGYFEGKGPAIRVEAVVDTNNGRPRILAYRNLTEMGRGWKSDMPP